MHQQKHYHIFVHQILQWRNVKTIIYLSDVGIKLLFILTEKLKKNILQYLLKITFNHSDGEGQIKEEEKTLKSSQVLISLEDYCNTTGQQVHDTNMTHQFSESHGITTVETFWGYNKLKTIYKTSITAKQLDIV